MPSLLSCTRGTTGCEAIRDRRRSAPRGLWMHTCQRMFIVGRTWTSRRDGSNQNWLAVESICSSVTSTALFFECSIARDFPRIGASNTTEELCYHRRIEGASLAGISAKLPNPETVVREVNEDEKRDALVRQVNRFEFAQSLTTLPSQPLKRVDLALYNLKPFNQSFQLPSALPVFAPSTDHISLALHALPQSPNLTHFSLRGDIFSSPCFFWPDSDNEISTKAPFWPRLEELDVCLNITTPSGQWLYMRDPSDSDHYMRDPFGSDLLTQSDLLELDEGENGSTHSSDSDNSEVPDTFCDSRSTLTARALSATFAPWSTATDCIPCSWPWPKPPPPTACPLCAAWPCISISYKTGSASSVWSMMLPPPKGMRQNRKSHYPGPADTGAGMSVPRPSARHLRTCRTHGRRVPHGGPRVDGTASDIEDVPIEIENV